jgi:hypothetical protein
MRGTMLVYRVEQEAAEVTPLDAVPDHTTLHDLVGGYLEHVPGFNTVLYGGKTCPCAAFVNETGKLDGLQFNQAATMEWEKALRRNSNTLFDSDGKLIDHLVGTVVVVLGDQEFMSEL